MTLKDFNTHSPKLQTSSVILFISVCSNHLVVALHSSPTIHDTVQRSRVPRMSVAMNGSLVPPRNLGVFFFVILVISVVPSRGFQQSPLLNAPVSLHSRILPTRRQRRRPMLHSTPQQVMTYRPIFDFANQTTVSRFERIDDAIMGGISLSSLKQSSEETFARWSGICRLDGGYVLYCVFFFVSLLCMMRCHPRKNGFFLFQPHSMSVLLTFMFFVII